MLNVPAKKPIHTEKELYTFESPAGPDKYVRQWPKTSEKESEAVDFDLLLRGCCKGI